VVRPWTQFYAPAKRDDMPLSECNDIVIRNIDIDTERFFDVGTSDKYRLRNFTFENCRVREKEKTFDPELIEGCKVSGMNIQY